MAVLIRSIASCKDSSVFLFLLLGATTLSLLSDEDVPGDASAALASESGKHGDCVRTNEGSTASSGLHASRVLTMANRLLNHGP